MLRLIELPRRACQKKRLPRDMDKAFAELEQALKEREPWLKWMKSDTMMDHLRTTRDSTKCLSL